MELSISPERPMPVVPAAPKKTRRRRPLPPQNAREWLTAGEAALTLGCSVATLHRLRRGLIAGVEPLPYSQYGRKVIFRKTSLAQWQDQAERREAA
jgi:Helix-turn-helix domain